jgi:hypothetical protein
LFKEEQSLKGESKIRVEFWTVDLAVYSMVAFYAWRTSEAQVALGSQTS